MTGECPCSGKLSRKLPIESWGAKPREEAFGDHWLNLAPKPCDRVACCWGSHPTFAAARLVEEGRCKLLPRTGQEKVYI